MRFIVLGFILTIVAGLFLAIRVSSGEATTAETLAGSLLAFVVIAPIIAYGIYGYVREQHIDDDDEPESMVLKQRELLDILRQKGPLSVHDMAHELDITPDEVYELVQQLIELDIFAGSLKADMLYPPNL